MKRLSNTDQNSRPLNNVPTPSASGDAANKSYVDTGLSGKQENIAVQPSAPSSPTDDQLWVDDDDELDLGLGDLAYLSLIGSALFDASDPLTPNKRSGGFKIGKLTTPTASSTLNVAGLGFKPKAIIFLFLSGTTQQTNGAVFGWGVWSEQNNGGANNYAAMSASNSTNFRRLHVEGSSLLEYSASSGTVRTQGYVSAVGNDGFTLTFTVNSSAIDFMYLALG